MGVAACNALIAHSLLAGHATPSAEALDMRRHGQRVLVARRALAVGTILTPDAVGFVDWPGELVGDQNQASQNQGGQNQASQNQGGQNPASSAYFIDSAASGSLGATPAKLAGMVVRTDIAEGQPISRGALVAPGDRGFLAATLGAGLRAITIPVTERSGVGGFVFPGDRVDLMLTQTLHGADSSGAEQPLSVTETILHNLRVLAIDQSMGGDLTDGHAAAHAPHTVTLEVSPRNAEKIEVAQSVGALSLTLRALTQTPADLAARADPDRAIASGTVHIPANASRQDEERLISQAAADEGPDGPGFVTGGDVSRFLRHSGSRMVAGAMATGAMTTGAMTTGQQAPVAVGPGRLGLNFAPPATSGSPAPAQIWRGGGIVTVSRGKDVTPVSVGGQ